MIGSLIFLLIAGEVAMGTQVMNLVEATGLEQMPGCTATLPAVAIQQDRCVLIQLLQCLLNNRQWYIHRAGQGAALVLMRVAHINKLCALVKQGACSVMGND